MRVSKEMYIERRTTKGRGRGDGSDYRDWYLIKYNSTGSGGNLNLGQVYFPKKFIGKKIRIKVEDLK